MINLIDYRQAMKLINFVLFLTKKVIIAYINIKYKKLESAYFMVLCKIILWICSILIRSLISLQWLMEAKT